MRMTTSRKSRVRYPGTSYPYDHAAMSYLSNPPHTAQVPTPPSPLSRVIQAEGFLSGCAGFGHDTMIDSRLLPIFGTIFRHQRLYASMMVMGFTTASMATRSGDGGRSSGSICGIRSASYCGGSGFGGSRDASYASIRSRYSRYDSPGLRTRFGSLITAPPSLRDGTTPG